VADAGQETGAQGGVGDRPLSWAGWASVADPVVAEIVDVGGGAPVTLTMPVAPARTAR
jgi:hypothetical protein